MNIVDRFLSYVAIETTSVDDSEVCPSNPNEFVLAKQLVEELKQLGVDNARMDNNGFVYGTVKSTVDHPTATIGFLAHMDTSNAASGANVKARIIENYDGNDIVLSEGIVTTVEDYPYLKKVKGKTLIVTDGTTLLGADDKAGIAVIMDFVQRCHEDPTLPHGQIEVCFTPDEEIGTGIHHIDTEQFHPDYAYTVDGSIPSEVTFECFNGATAHVTFNGNSIHPGSAKGKMINACQLAIDFHNMLPVFDRPEHTEGREGFNHLTGMSGDCQSAQSTYIIRNHDLTLLRKQMKQFEKIAETMNCQYDQQVVTLSIHEAYHNMKECFDGKEYILDNAREAVRELGYEPFEEPVRGGTDGSHLSFMGIPTPNLGNGGQNYHGNHEYLVVEEMKEAVEVVTKIALKGAK